MSNSKWCKSATGAGHTCRRKAQDDGLCWQHQGREKFAPWRCNVCGEIMTQLKYMVGKPVTDRQVDYINNLLITRAVTPEEAGKAKLWLAAAEETSTGRDIAFILVHQLLHKEQGTEYRQSYLD